MKRQIITDHVHDHYCRRFGAASSGDPSEPSCSSRSKASTASTNSGFIFAAIRSLPINTILACLDRLAAHIQDFLIYHALTHHRFLGKLRIQFRDISHESDTSAMKNVNAFDFAPFLKMSLVQLLVTTLKSNFKPARALWSKVFEDGAKEHFVKNVSGHLGNVSLDRIKTDQVAIFLAVDKDSGNRVAKAISLKDTPEPYKPEPAAQATKFAPNLKSSGQMIFANSIPA
ncbi:hypothetical protein PGT21_036590 [Puccinia graminis f. sp. tritici]|uniref:Catalase immune-responsive domain-containing protein n=1 Tax=Puccinia graminis f. sp. tritici TaxID=56615 RepID=A0A5B0PM23_PUCGR|nr:hypothetical protein PGT21_036550 [Puccinia graminis f. sp. tritici]KAA1102181.1 hypothetical protein PGT21_036590 [Puccinia graminis f. sp. tritici]